MTIYSQIEGNKRKTWLLMLISVAVVTLFGYVLGQVTEIGSSLVVVAFSYSLVSSLFSFYFSDRVALSLSGAKKISETDNPRLFHLVENLCIGAGLKMPQVYVMDDRSLNAFATGRDPEHASIAVTTGLIESLDKLELEGVIAHELSHIQNYDIRLMTVVVVLVGTLAILADIFLRSLWFGGDRDRRGGGALIIVGLVMAIIAPIVAQLIKLAISRRREFLADASGALLTRYPDGLASALEKIRAGNIPLKDANPATAHLFISNPFKESGVVNLFSTHPPIEERIKRLREM